MIISIAIITLKEYHYFNESFGNIFFFSKWIYFTDMRSDHFYTFGY